MNTQVAKVSIRLASACLAIALPPSLMVKTAEAQTSPVGSLVARVPYDRINAPKLRPKHIRTYGLRADRVGDTPSSPKYYKITNITAEVGGYSGIAFAVNNDGRIAYTESPDVGTATAYVVNNAGGFGKLVAPHGAPRGTSYYAYALNEKGEVVGAFENGAKNGGSHSGPIAWTLSGSSGSSVAYWGNSNVFGYETAVNNHEVGAGWVLRASGSGYAALFDGLSKPAGKTIGLRDVRNVDCNGDSIVAIDDAGDMVGNSCMSATAVRFSLTGYAKPLPISPANTPSFAFAMNQRGDVVGEAGEAPFGGAYLLRDGKTTYLPLPVGSPNSNWFVAVGVNASDEVIGTLCADGCGPFLYANGRTYDLNTLIPPNSGWQIIDALGINDSGEIVGDGYYNGTLYGISLKPPHP